MDYKDWVILKTINEERNLTKAAQRLFISQPALTYRLQNLEHDVGVKILIRHSNGVFFTPKGEYLLKYAEEMLEQWEQVQHYVRNMESSIHGTLRLGVSSVIAKFKMAPLLKNFKKNFPDVEIILHTGSSTLQLPDMLQKEQIDIAILRGDTSWQENIHIIAEEPMCILFSQPIEIRQLPHIPWIRYEASAITKSDAQLNNWWTEQFSLPLPTIIKVDSIEASIQMVSYGLGWCILPKIHINNCRSLFSCPVVWNDGHIMLRKTIMAYRLETLQQPICKLFIDHVLRDYSS